MEQRAEREAHPAVCARGDTPTASPPGTDPPHGYVDSEAGQRRRDGPSGYFRGGTVALQPHGMALLAPQEATRPAGAGDRFLPPRADAAASHARGAGRGTHGATSGARFAVTHRKIFSSAAAVRTPTPRCGIACLLRLGEEA